ncbi:Acyl-coenzyme A thioesterase 13 [Hondaea fermentalgiana]|uniref:Acyl-coenzyme A thioesterase 13 n=1 Tax=Hondaea fermentalgiana TaxID=2315210 RepID=A0A2R5GFN3_9STRA|nr:Acyl-coenzyme A thioesterase 13 [Hondaea fermentalgiana]|eukprot:GBG29730.1 Acyl-coenzyme A thioesterase 13 [Hondaea fermentalgiana]
MAHRNEENAGPLWSNKTKKTCGMYCTKKNLNGGHVMHGGCLTTLADAALFTIGEDDLQPNKGWTSNLNMNFVAPVRLGEWVEARGKVTSSTKFLLFLTGELHVDERIVATFTGIVKKAGPHEGHDEDGKLVIDNFEERMGPLWCNKTAKKCGMYCTKNNLNGGYVMHGGCLATLADASLFTIGVDEIPNLSVTANLNMNYVSPVRLGEWVEARGKVTSSTKYLLFISGELHVDERIVATFTGIVKKGPPRSRI